jgi:hypothetical protein
MRCLQLHGRLMRKRLWAHRMPTRMLTVSFLSGAVHRGARQSCSLPGWAHGQMQLLAACAKRTHCMHMLHAVQRKRSLPHLHIVRGHCDMDAAGLGAASTAALQATRCLASHHRHQALYIWTVRTGGTTPRDLRTGHAANT